MSAESKAVALPPPRPRLGQPCRRGLGWRSQPWRAHANSNLERIGAWRSVLAPQPKRLHGLEVDDQLKLRGLLAREVSGLGAR